MLLLIVQILSLLQLRISEGEENICLDKDVSVALRNKNDCNIVRPIIFLEIPQTG